MAVGLHLIIQHRNGSSFTHELTSQVTRIGRDATNDVILDYVEVSRKHARLMIVHDTHTHFIIEDLNSRNGTFINDRPISGVAALRIGDVIHISSEIVMVLEDGFFERESNGQGDTRPFGKSAAPTTKKEITVHREDDLLDLDLPQLQEEAQNQPTMALAQHLFISHADTDNMIADRLVMGLESLDVQTWVDHKQLKPSHHWEQEIQNALNTSWGGLLVISRDALESMQCNGERQFFLRKYQRQEKELFIVLIEPFKLDELPYSLSVVQFIDLSTDFKTGLNKLLKAIKEKAPISSDLVQETHYGKRPKTTVANPLPMPRIFISHSYDDADEEVVYQLQETLQDASFQVDFYGYEPGTVRWRMEVSEAIDRAECVIVIISPEAKASEWLQHELFYAEARHKGVFGVHVRGEVATLFGFNLILQVNLQTGYDAAMRRLVSALERHLRGDNKSVPR